MALKLKMLLLVAIVAGLLYFALQYTSQTEVLNSNKAYGTVDIKQSTLAFQKSGPIVQLLVDEGTKVAEGQLLASLDTQDLEHQYKIQSAQCKSLEATLTRLQNGYRAEEISMAKANVLALENSLKLADATYQRYQNLYERRSTSAQERDNAYYTMLQIKANLDNARANLEMQQNGYRIEEIETAQANVDNCQQSLAYLDYQIKEQSKIVAPFAGVIRTKLKELGDYATAGAGVLELSLISPKRVRVYVSYEQLSNLTLGQAVTVYIDDEHKAASKIAYISETAMFTPRTVQTEALRPDLVYEVRIDLDDDADFLHLGQPVSVEF